MSILDQLNTVKNDFKKIATLHKPELESTAEFASWNGAYMQLIKLKVALAPNKDPLKAAEFAKNILNGSMAEMEKEIPQMVSAENKELALELYTQLKNNFSLLISDISPKPEAQSSLMSSPR